MPSESPKPPSSEYTSHPDRSHPWRLCPTGHHWVRENPLTVPITEQNPTGETIRRGHCRINPGSKDIITADELREIARLYFNDLINNPDVMPVPDALGFPDGNRYDREIAGWTRFWNEVLNPKNPLTADFAKALIATESGFKTHLEGSSSDGAVRGLIQITENTRKILKDSKGEMKDHLIDLSPEECEDPLLNIAAGIRWLHHNRELLERRIRRTATPEEIGAEYKGIYGQQGKVSRADRIMNDLKRYHAQLKSKRKQQ